MSGAVVWRKVGLLAHVTASVGWLGAVAAFLAVAVVGLRSADGEATAAAYVALVWITRLAIVPFCFAALVTGVVQSLATPWGLLRYYWVVLKLVLTVLATAILLAHTRVIDLAARAARHAAAGGDFDRLRVQLVADAAAGLAALLVIMALSVFKPRGVTSYGRRRGAAPLDAQSHTLPK
jgi:hypothetical protein